MPGGGDDDDDDDDDDIPLTQCRRQLKSRLRRFYIGCDGVSDG